MKTEGSYTRFYKMMLIDTHVHLNMKNFSHDLDRVISRAKEAGISILLNVGFDRKSSEESINLASKYKEIYAIIGVHPHYSKDINDNDLEWLYNIAGHPKVVAIGEIGLDFYYKNSDPDIQRCIFKAQMEIAKSVGLPVVIHSREAHESTKKILFEYNIPTLLHCFSGSLELAEEYIKKGFYIALGGIVTFKNAKKAKRVAANININHLVLETDCPYMAPVPYRGKRNEPSYIINVANKIALLRDMHINDIVDITTQNAVRFFGLKEG